MPLQVLITGAHGFIGRHVAKQFSEKGALVNGIGHGTWTREELDRFGLSLWHTADVSVENLATYGGEPDIIVHCAGSGSVPFSVTHPFQDYTRTVTTTAAVLEYIRLYSPQSILVYPSSAAVYGVVDTLPIQETAPLKPTSPYGAHKLMAEQLCRSYAQNFGIAIAVVRLFSIYGEGLKKQLLWDACSKIAQGNLDFFGSGSELRDWLHVEDAAHLLEAASGFASPACPVVNGGSGEGIAVREILGEILDCYGLKQSLNFSGKSRTGDPHGYQANMTLMNDRGWFPKINWRDGIRRYVEWYKEGFK